MKRKGNEKEKEKFDPKNYHESIRINIELIGISCHG